MHSVGEGEGGKIWENDIETRKVSCKKRDGNNPFKKKSQVKLCEEGYKIKTYFIFLIYTFHFLIQFQRKTGSLYLCFSQFSCSVVSYSLQPCGLQHARLPCQSPTPRACSNSCPLSQHVRWMVIPSNHLILYRPPLVNHLPFPQSQELPPSLPELTAPGRWAPGGWWHSPCCLLRRWESSHCRRGPCCALRPPQGAPRSPQVHGCGAGGET